MSRLLSSTIGLGVLLFRLAERRLAKASLYDQAAGEVDASVVVVLTVLSVTESAMSALRDPSELSNQVQVKLPEDLVALPGAGETVGEPTMKPFTSFLFAVVVETVVVLRVVLLVAVVKNLLIVVLRVVL